MGLRPSFSPDDIRAKLEADARRIEAAIITRLAYLGEECVNHARSLNTYKDQTGNLRSSVGYLIARDGRILKQFFETANKDEGGAGKSTARKIALEVLTGAGSGYALIVVAGMNYASKVEAKGYDVLSSAEQYAKKELPKMKAQLKSQIARMK